MSIDSKNVKSPQLIFFFLIHNFYSKGTCCAVLETEFLTKLFKGQNNVNLVWAIILSMHFIISVLLSKEICDSAIEFQS